MGKFILKFQEKTKHNFLNKLTHFDLRAKKFSNFTLAQTLIARIDCSIYNLKDK